jgi:type II secretion system protein G
MRFAHSHRLQRGFTLIELLIVVIILAILAAIVIPQFSSTTGDAKESALDSNLATMRSAIELYKVQHQNNYPGVAASGTAPTCTTKGATAAGAQAFIDQLTLASDANGNTCTVADTNYRFGPYLRGAVASEPVSGKGTVAADIVVTASGAAIAPAAATGGWAYDSKSGQIVANSNALDVKGKALSTH